MKKKFIWQLLSLVLCLMLTIPLLALDVFAANDNSEDEDVDIWDALYPAYMTTAFRSINNRILGNDVIHPMECMLVKDGFALYIDKLTGEMVLLQLSEPDETGEYELGEDGIYKYDAYFSTNPYNIGTSQSPSTGTSTSEAKKSELYSQVIVDYSEQKTELTFNSFVDAAKNDQINVKPIRSGVRVEYTLGREEVAYLVPRLIKREKLEELQEQIGLNSPVSSDSRRFGSFYLLKDPNDETLSQKSKVEMVKAYPICERFPVYVCEPHITPKELLRLERWVKLYTDYSFDQLDIDHAETEYVSKDKAPPLFKLAIEYTIDDLGLSVRCNAGNIRFDSSSYKLSNVTLLPFAGAGNVNNTGYIFTPDGSGTIMQFENFKGVNFKTTNQLYGQDHAFHTISGANKEVMRLPVYGVVEIVKDQYSTMEEVIVVDEETGEEELKLEKVMHDLKIGYLAVIEQGDSLAKITVENGGSVHMFSSVYTSFNPRPKDTYTLYGGITATADANAMWTVESKRKYTGDFKIRYFMLSEDISYSEMASTYRKYLEKKGVITRKESVDEDIPLYIETLGALETVKHIMGIPIETTVSLTSFDDTIEILEFLKEKGIKNVKLKLTGWANEGLFPLVPTGIDIVDVLGGDKGFEELLTYAKENNIHLYPDLDFAQAIKDKAFDGFDSSKDLTRTIDDRSAGKKEYNPLLQEYVFTGLGIISPNVMSKFYDKTMKEYLPLGVGGISVSALGDILTSDFNTKDTLHREDSKTLVSRLLSQIAEDNGKVMLSGGNSYALPYATDILDLPLEDSRYRYSSANIPFMGMILHGYKDYAGVAINLAGDYQYTLLKSIENGASPYFIIAYDNTSELKKYNNSFIAKYYSVRYNIWVEDMVKTYHLLNDVLKNLQDKLIVSHELLDDSNRVVKVTYENGEAFYINYLLVDFPITIGDKLEVIPAEGFLKTDGDDSIIFRSSSVKEG